MVYHGVVWYNLVVITYRLRDAAEKQCLRVPKVRGNGTDALPFRNGPILGGTFNSVYRGLGVFCTKIQGLGLSG